MSFPSPKPFSSSSSIPIFPPSFLLYSFPLHSILLLHSTSLHLSSFSTQTNSTPLPTSLHFTSLMFLYHSSFSLLFLFTILLSTLLFSPPLPFSLSVSVSLCVSVSVFLAFSLSLNYLIHPSIFFSSFHLLLHTYFSLSTSPPTSDFPHPAAPHPTSSSSSCCASSSSLLYTLVNLSISPSLFPPLFYSLPSLFPFFLVSSASRVNYFLHISLTKVLPTLSYHPLFLLLNLSLFFSPYFCSLLQLVLPTCFMPNTDRKVTGNPLVIVLAHALEIIKSLIEKMFGHMVWLERCSGY